MPTYPTPQLSGNKFGGPGLPRPAVRRMPPQGPPGYSGNGSNNDMVAAPPHRGPLPPTMPPPAPPQPQRAGRPAPNPNYEDRASFLRNRYAQQPPQSGPIMSPMPYPAPGGGRPGMPQSGMITDWGDSKYGQAPTPGMPQPAPSGRDGDVRGMPPWMQVPGQMPPWASQDPGYLPGYGPAGGSYQDLVNQGYIQPGDPRFSPQGPVAQPAPTPGQGPVAQPAPTPGQGPGAPPPQGGGQDQMPPWMRARLRRNPGGGGMRGAPQGAPQGPQMFDPANRGFLNGRSINDVNNLYGVDASGWYDSQGNITNQGIQGWGIYDQGMQSAPQGSPQPAPFIQEAPVNLRYGSPYYGGFQYGRE